MTLALKESRALADIAELFYDFLPGSGNPRWKGHVSFKTISEKVGVGDFWQPGSKLAMITRLLERTLEFRRGKFDPLVLEIVRAALTYRQKEGKSIAPAEIERLNGHLMDVGFRFPDLWDPEFISSLRLDSTSRAKRRMDEVIEREQRKVAEESARSVRLRETKERFFGLHAEPSPQRAGLLFESVLNQMFEVYGLGPREPFRVTGEQIDGSFDLDHETYLVEAKWVREPVPESSLLIFRGKIEGKSAFTRGIFISLNGITAEARHAITQGKQPTFYVIDGYDLTMVLTEQVGLLDFLRWRRRMLAEEGQLVVPFSELWRKTQK